jgi:hypothetical protein
MSQEVGSFLAAAGIIAGVALFVPCVQWVVRGWARYRAGQAAAKTASVARSEELPEEIA